MSGSMQPLGEICNKRSRSALTMDFPVSFTKNSL
ncbi:hypothetical protein [Sporisorium scitamineum]|uniref:Uncharacterized protein n=1 Tax=Sporisorium scitamineum TaxID=49012 RepID=A0A0F7RRL3_9BASI|nr:hypothetical protein [Sporisorium scitamineum]